MTFEEVDLALASWNQRLAAIADNLLELQQDATYQVLTGAGGAPRLRLTGQTAARIVPALAEMDTIFQHFASLQSVVDRAAQLRRDARPIFGRDQALREIEKVLLGESIALPAAAVSLGQRTLLSGDRSARGMRPEALLQGMVAAFAAARDAVLTVSGAWDDLAVEADAAEQQIRGLHAQALDSGCAVPLELQKAEHLLARVKAQVQSDPLAALGELRIQLRPALDAAQHRLQARGRLLQHLKDAREVLDRLRRLRQEVAVAAARAHAKIVGFTEPAESGGEEPLLRLSDWLERLEKHCGEDQVDSAAMGLKNWHTSAEVIAERELEVLRRYRMPLEARDELRGRFDALKAKARGYGVAEDSQLAALAGSIESLLYTQPADLARSAAALEAYGSRLNGNARPQQVETSDKGDRG